MNEQQDIEFKSQWSDTVLKIADVFLWGYIVKFIIGG